MAERLTEIYSLLVPLGDGRLIVPRSCIAEVIGYTPPTPVPSVPPWYLGTVSWGARSLPLISFEGTCGQQIPGGSGRSRIVIFHALTEALDARAFAIVSQGFPQLVRITTDVIRPDNTRAIPERWPVLCQVRMMKEAPLVPDIERLESLIAQETSVAA